MGNNKRINRSFIGMPRYKESTSFALSIVCLYALNEETISLVGFFNDYFKRRYLVCFTL